MPLKQDVEEFPIGTFARVFFDQRTYWLRWHTKQITKATGEEFGTRRDNRKPGGGDRLYYLSDAPRIAKALRKGGVLDDDGYRAVMARYEALKHPVFPDETNNSKKKP